jgi:hypothetical protein
VFYFYFSFLIFYFRTAPLFADVTILEYLPRYPFLIFSSNFGNLLKRRSISFLGTSRFIDINEKTINLLVPKKEIERRLSKLPKFELKIKKGYLGRYSKMVTSANKGAVLK